MNRQIWYRGNIHTHTTESDGDAEPEFVAAWYKDHGYDFLVLSDHNHLTLLDYGDRNDASVAPLMIPGEEVTVRMNGSGTEVHVNAIGINRLVEPTDTGNIATTLQANISAIREAGGIASINHPSWKWSFDHEPIIKTRGASHAGSVQCRNKLQQLLYPHTRFPQPIPRFGTMCLAQDSPSSASRPTIHIITMTFPLKWTIPDEAG